MPQQFTTRGELLAQLFLDIYTAFMYSSNIISIDNVASFFNRLLGESLERIDLAIITVNSGYGGNDVAYLTNRHGMVF